MPPFFSPIIPGAPSTMSVSTTAPVSESNTQSGRSVQQESSKYWNMAKNFLADASEEIGTTATNLTQGDVGKLLTSPVKLLGMFIHFSGKFIQGGHDFTSNPLRYMVGGSVKLIANSVEWAADAGRAAIDTGISIVKTLGAWSLALDEQELGLNKNVNVERPLDKFVDAGKAAAFKFMEITSSNSKGIDKDSIFYNGNLPPNWKPATTSDLPPQIMAPRQGEKFNSEKLNLHVEKHLSSGATQNLMVIRSDAWSALRIGVFKNDKTGDVYLYFHGTDPLGRPGTLKSDANILLGIRDRAQDDANIVIKAFAHMLPPGKLKLVGHSLGGNLVTEGALKYSTPDNIIEATTVNALGLSVTQQIDLHEKIQSTETNKDKAIVTNYFTGKDPVQIANKALAHSLVGTTVRLPDKGGHGSGVATEKYAQALRTTISAAKTFGQLPDNPEQS